MKFSYIALFLVLALIAAFAYAEDGTKATATIKLETKLTDAELDTKSSYWSFDGIFMQDIHAAIAAWVPTYVFTAQYALNKKEVEVIIYYPPGKYDKPSDAVLDGLVEAINADIPTTETNKVTGISIKSTSMDADCFDGDAVTEECNPILDGCTKDDECANFSICVFTCTKDEECTVDGETCIIEEGKTEGECGVAPVEDCTAEGAAECAEGFTCNPDTKKCEEDAPPAEDCTAEGAAECAEGFTCNPDTKKCEEDAPPAEFRALQNEAKGKCSKREAKNSASATTVALTFAMTIAMAALMIA